MIRQIALLACANISVCASEEMVYESVFMCLCKSAYLCMCAQSCVSVCECTSM